MFIQELNPHNSHYNIFVILDSSLVEIRVKIDWQHSISMLSIVHPRDAVNRAPHVSLTLILFLKSKQFHSS